MTRSSFLLYNQPWVITNHIVHYIKESSFEKNSANILLLSAAGGTRGVLKCDKVPLKK